VVGERTTAEPTCGEWGLDAQAVAVRWPGDPIDVVGGRPGRRVVLATVNPSGLGPASHELDGEAMANALVIAQAKALYVLAVRALHHLERTNYGAGYLAQDLRRVIAGARGEGVQSCERSN
jgi:hypothetical protein